MNQTVYSLIFDFLVQCDCVECNIDGYLSKKRFKYFIAHNYPNLKAYSFTIYRTLTLHNPPQHYF